MNRIASISQHRSISWFVAAVFAAVALLFSTAASAQMQDSTIKVFGMDCAPCAHGISQRLEKMEGIKKANVDLNTGDVAIEVAKNNDLTLRAIRKKVQKSGFTPRNAELQMHVRVVKADGQPVFELPAGEKYRATNDLSADLEVGDEVTLSGTTNAELKESPTPIGIEVTDVTKQDKDES